MSDMPNDKLVIQTKLFSERIAPLLIKPKSLRIDPVQDQGSFFLKCLPAV